MNRIFLLLLLVFIGPNIGWAQEEAPPSSPIDRSWSFVRDQGLTGAFRFDYYRSSKALDDESDFFGGSAQIKLLPKVGDRLDGKIEIRLMNPAVGTGADTDLTLLEGYGSVHLGKADLRIGKQIIAWGRADGINPTDNLTPHDYTVLLPFEEDQRLGTTALRLDVYPASEFAVALFVTPLFEASKIPLPFPPGFRIMETIPERSLSHTETGLKLDHTGGRLDWSISYFHGFDLLPDARITGLLPSGTAIELRHNRIDVFGADAAKNFGRFGVRAEAAYVLTADRNGRDPTVKNPFLFIVAGADRKFFDNLTINVQGVGRWVQRFRDPTGIADPNSRAIGIQNAIFDNQQDRTSYGMTCRISDKWLNDTLEAEILTFINFRRTNAYLRPLVTYAFTDHVKGTIGGEMTFGPRESFFGELARNRGVFTELRYSF